MLGTGSFALWALFTTEPYVAGAAYVDGMPDHCRDCRFSPGRDCPLPPLSRAFPDRHAERLRGHLRLRVALGSLARRAPGRRRRDRATFERVRRVLARGAELRPADVGDRGGSAPSTSGAPRSRSPR